jgi:DNA-binding MarR family transcriptional regulator
VALLDKRKLVARKANRDDMRESFLSLTPAGRSIYDDLAPAALAFVQQLLTVVDPADRPALDRALHRISERSAELANKPARR